MPVGKALSKYKLDLVGVQENTHFSTERGMGIMNWVKVKVKLSPQQALEACRDVTDPTLSRQSAHRWW
jgi:hypothetical protein